MKIAIFDLDGTLANINHRLHHIQKNKKNWTAFFKACDKDSPKHAVIQSLKGLHQLGHPIWILTGRSAIVKKQTQHWLKQHNIPYDKLIMRDINDKTHDYQLKQQWITQYKLKHNTLCIYEDRQNVVDMWRNEGFECFQVAVEKT